VRVSEFRLLVRAVSGHVVDPAALVATTPTLHSNPSGKDGTSSRALSSAVSVSASKPTTVASAPVPASVTTRNLGGRRRRLVCDYEPIVRHCKTRTESVATAHVTSIRLRVSERGWPVWSPRADDLELVALPCLLYSMDLTVLNLAVPKLSVALSTRCAQPSFWPSEPARSRWA
jgi:hypothetical protein